MSANTQSHFSRSLAKIIVHINGYFSVKQCKRWPKDGNSLQVAKGVGSVHTISPGDGDGGAHEFTLSSALRA